GVDLDVINRGLLAAVGDGFNANLIAGAQCQAADAAARRRVRVRLRRRQPVVGHPLVNQLLADKELERRLAIALIKVWNVEVEPAGLAVVAKAGRTMPLAARAGDGFASRSRFPGRDVADLITRQSHRFGLDAVRVAPGPAFRVTDAGLAQ